MRKPGPLDVRMKGYEQAVRTFFVPRMPLIIRVDGKAFHTLTRNMDRPFDSRFMGWMRETALYLCEHVQGCRLAYVQSDEISLLLTDYEKLTSQPWLGGGVQKVVSVSASLATTAFVLASGLEASFDSRAFNLPRHEVTNYFVWRQRDCRRNSILSVAQERIGRKKIHGLNTATLRDDLAAMGCPWEECSDEERWGTYMRREHYDGPENSIRHRWRADSFWLQDDRAACEDLVEPKDPCGMRAGLSHAPQDLAEESAEGGGE